MSFLLQGVNPVEAMPTTQLGALAAANPVLSFCLLVAFFLLCLLLIYWWYTQFSASSMANQRAEMLLREQLTPDEYQHLLKYGYLAVPSKLDPSRQYRIPRARGRVQMLQTCMIGATSLHRKVAELCVVARDPVPDADMILTHKWMLEADEAGYLKLANWSRVMDSQWYTEKAA